MTMDLDYLQWSQFIITCHKENKETILISIIDNGKGSPWVSIQGPILFNISVSNLFLANNDVNFVSCAYNSTIYQTAKNADDITNHTQNSAEIFFGLDYQFTWSTRDFNQTICN